MMHKLVVVVEIEASSIENARARFDILRKVLGGRDRTGDGLLMFEVPEIVEVLRMVARRVVTGMDPADLLALQDDIGGILQEITEPTTTPGVIPFPTPQRSM